MMLIKQLSSIVRSVRSTCTDLQTAFWHGEKAFIVVSESRTARRRGVTLLYCINLLTMWKLYGRKVALSHPFECGVKSEVQDKSLAESVAIVGHICGVPTWLTDINLSMKLRQRSWFTLT